MPAIYKNMMQQQKDGTMCLKKRSMWPKAAGKWEDNLVWDTIEDDHKQMKIFIVFLNGAKMFLVS